MVNTRVAGLPTEFKTYVTETYTDSSSEQWPK